MPEVLRLALPPAPADPPWVDPGGDGDDPDDDDPPWVDPDRAGDEPS